MSSNKNWHSVRLYVGADIDNISDDVDEVPVQKLGLRDFTVSCASYLAIRVMLMFIIRLYRNLLYLFAIIETPEKLLRTSNEHVVHF
jgi:hypothetical protein